MNVPSKTSVKTKGNPAAHRMSNDRLKARRKACWARGQRRKDARRRAQEAAHEINVARGMTAWEIAKAARFAARH
jgi:hypothetical protein